MNVTAHNTSSTSILVQWKAVPEDHVNGILRGYHVFYKRADKVNTSVNVVRVNVSTLSAELQGLKKYGEYVIRVAAFTVGDGKKSIPEFCRTDEDSKSVLDSVLQV